MEGETVFESNGLLGFGTAPEPRDDGVHLPRPRAQAAQAASEAERQPEATVDEAVSLADVSKGGDTAATATALEPELLKEPLQAPTPRAGDEMFESNGLLGMAPLPAPASSGPSPSAGVTTSIQDDPLFPLTDAELGIGPSSPPAASPPRARRVPIVPPSLPVWQPPIEARTADGRAVQFRRKRKVAGGEAYAGVSLRKGRRTAGRRGNGVCADKPVCRAILPAQPTSERLSELRSAGYARVQASRGDQGGPECVGREQVRGWSVAWRIYVSGRHAAPPVRLQAQFDAEAIAIAAGPAAPGAAPVATAARKQMWVDKYRPARFTDLLGEEVGPAFCGCLCAQPACAGS